MVASNGLNKAFAQEFVTNGMNNEEAMQTHVRARRSAPGHDRGARGHHRRGHAACSATAADQGAPMPAIPAMAEVWTPLGQAYSAILGGADPTTTMNQTQETIAAAIAAS